MRLALKEKAMVAENRPDRSSRHAGRAIKKSRQEPDELKELLERAKDEAADTFRIVKNKTHAAIQNVKQTTQDLAGGVMNAVQEEAERAYEQQKERVVGRVQKVGKLTKQAAHALRAVKADDAAEFVDRAAERVGQTRDYLEDKTLSQMLEDASDVVRRHQGVVAGGLVIVGFALARFLKSSASRDQQDDADGGDVEDSAEQEDESDEQEADDESQEQDEEEYASSGARNGAGRRHSWR